MIGTFIKCYIHIMTAVMKAGPTACRPFLTATLTLKPYPLGLPEADRWLHMTPHMGVFLVHQDTVLCVW